MSGGTTVAIWGSCVTRDAWALQSRADDLEQRLPLLYYGARSSWVSQASPPYRGPAPDLEGMASGFGRRMVEEDLAKTILDRLVEHRPQILVLDLIDERLPLVRIDRSWVTVSDYLKQAALGDRLLAEHRSTVNPIGERGRLFSKAVRRLVPQLVRRLPETTFVLNEAPYTHLVGGGATMPEPQAGWARQLEAAQRPLIDTLVRAFGPRLVRATPPPAVRLADPDHRWGVASYHYVEEYYHWLIDVLLSVADGDRPRVADLRGSAWRRILR